MSEPISEDDINLTSSRCNGENHIARDCLAPRDESTKKCYKCQELGHIAANCTQVEAAATEELPAAE
jgi:cellular nucleic acid-binding protein